LINREGSEELFLHGTLFFFVKFQVFFIIVFCVFNVDIGI
jgi:hypothetical protein